MDPVLRDSPSHHTKIPSYVLGAASTGSTIVDKGGGKALNDLLTILFFETSDIAVLRKHIKNLKECRGIAKRDGAKALGTERYARTVFGAPESCASGLKYVIRRISRRICKATFLRCLPKTWIL